MKKTSSPAAASGGGDAPARYRAVVNCGRPVTGMEIEIRDASGDILPDRGIGKVFVRGTSVMHSYFRDQESTDACLIEGWLDTGDMGYMSGGYIFIVGRAKDMIIINGRNHWPQDIEWAVEQLPGFKSGDIAAFAITGPSGEETPAVLVHCRVSDPEERGRLRDDIRERVRAITGITPVVELIPRAPCPAPARASSPEPRHAASTSPAKSNPTISQLEPPSITPPTRLVRLAWMDKPPKRATPSYVERRRRPASGAPSLS